MRLVLLVSTWTTTTTTTSALDHCIVILCQKRHYIVKDLSWAGEKNDETNFHMEGTVAFRSLTSTRTQPFLNESQIAKSALQHYEVAVGICLFLVLNRSVNLRRPCLDFLFA